MHTEAFTRAFTHKNFYTQKLLHMDALTQALLQKHFYTQILLHINTFKDVFTRRSFYTQTLSHTLEFRDLHWAAFNFVFILNFLFCSNFHQPKAYLETVSLRQLRPKFQQGSTVANYFKFNLAGTSTSVEQKRKDCHQDKGPVLRRFSKPRIGSVGESCFVDDLVSCWGKRGAYRLLLEPSWR